MQLDQLLSMYNKTHSQLTALEEQILLYDWEQLAIRGKRHLAIVSHGYRYNVPIYESMRVVDSYISKNVSIDNCIDDGIKHPKIAYSR